MIRYILPGWRHKNECRECNVGHHVGVLVLTLMLLSGCGGTPATTPAPSLHAMTHPRIVPHAGGNPDALYVPDPIRIRVGQTITWTNTDTEAHDVTADNGLFSSRPIATGASYRWTPRQAGTYTYSCTLHPDMHGTIVVRPSER